MVLRLLMCCRGGLRHALTDSEFEHDSMLLLQHKVMSSVMAITQRGSLSAVAAAATLSCNVDTACGIS